MRTKAVVIALARRLPVAPREGYGHRHLTGYL
jgi:hypothetical protein